MPAALTTGRDEGAMEMPEKLAPLLLARRRQLGRNQANKDNAERIAGRLSAPAAARRQG
jgi:hypothetical protein